MSILIFLVIYTSNTISFITEEVSTSVRLIIWDTFTILCNGFPKNEYISYNVWSLFLNSTQ